MSEVTAPVRPFAPGDRVEVRRNLDHPAWQTLVNADDRHGGSRWVRREGLEERLGESVVSKAGVQRGHACVWLDDTRLWYLQDTGMQEGSEATYLAHLEVPAAADHDHLDDEIVDRTWHDPRITTHIAVYGRGLFEAADFPWSHDGDLDAAMYAFPAGESAGRIPCFDCDCTGWAGGPGVIDERCNTCKGTGRVWVGL